jgi:TnpA family transposase
MRSKNKNLALFSTAEKSALYELPDFNNSQRLEYLTLSNTELQIALNYQSLSTKVYCILQIGYFKAIQMFFKFTWNDPSQEDIDYILQQYFPGQELDQQLPNKHQYYAQCNAIAMVFGYKTWTKSYEAILFTHAKKVILRDIKPQFIAMELLSFLQEQKIIRPKYTTLQAIVSAVINDERKRLSLIITQNLTKQEQLSLQSLLFEDDSLSKLASLKQDAKDFKARMMANERDKLILLQPFYQIIKNLLPKLKLSQQNIDYYANLINYYTVYDLRKKLKTEQTYLYLLCYIQKRYQQLNDNLINAFCYHFKHFENNIKEQANTRFSQHAISQQKELATMKRLAQLYVDDNLSDDISFGMVRKQAFAILSKDELLNKVSSSHKSPQEIDFHWQALDGLSRRFKAHLRPLVMTLNFSSMVSNNQWLLAIQWLKTIFTKQQSLSGQLLEDCPCHTIPIRLQSYLTIDNDNKSIKINPTRYEFWIYRQLYNNLKIGTIFLEDSIQYRCLNQELVSLEEKDDLIKQLHIPALTKPINQQLDELFTELHQLWKSFNKALRGGKLKHLRYDDKTKTLHQQKAKINKEEQLQHHFYQQLPLCDITDILRFVNQRCNFLSAFTHIQPRYAKQPVNEDCLIGTIIAQAMNNGNLNMSEISDISYDLLQDTLQSRIRLATLKAANDLISNDIANMSIFPFYSFDISMLYGGVDGQKFEVETPTIKTRYSKKYFRKGKGIVAYTLLTNHIPLQVELIGANEHESYFMFDIWHNNTSEISPDIITGDMHSINKANFAIMHWFGAKLHPRFRNIEAQRKHLYCGINQEEYQKYLIQPIGQINRQLIEQEWPNLQRIIVTLGLKEMTQSTLIKKLCNYRQENQTRKALFEFDKLIRSIYTLKYLLDPTIEHNTHRSQNRVEAYHQLRAAIAQAYGKKQLIGKTDIALEISNQCGRLVANAIIHYNSAILSKLRDKHEIERDPINSQTDQVKNNQRALGLLKRISLVAWRHIHFQGHFIFSDVRMIDLDGMIRGLVLDYW